MLMAPMLAWSWYWSRIGICEVQWPASTAQNSRENLSLTFRHFIAPALCIDWVQLCWSLGAIPYMCIVSFWWPSTGAVRRRSLDESFAVISATFHLAQRGIASRRQRPWWFHTRLSSRSRLITNSTLLPSLVEHWRLYRLLNPISCFVTESRGTQIADWPNIYDSSRASSGRKNIFSSMFSRVKKFFSIAAFLLGRCFREFIEAEEEKLWVMLSHLRRGVGGEIFRLFGF